MSAGINAKLTNVGGKGSFSPCRVQYPVKNGLVYYITVFISGIKIKTGTYYYIT